MKTIQLSSWGLGFAGAALAVVACSAQAPAAPETTGTASAAVSEAWDVVSTSPFITAIGGGNAALWGISNQVAADYGSAGIDYDIYQLGSSGWSQIGGGAQQVAVDPVGGTPWVVNHAGTVYKGNGSGGWTVVSTSPAMTNIGVRNGIAWAIGKQVAANYGAAGIDYDIYQFVNGAWVQIGGGAQQVAVAPDTGLPWVVNHAGTVYKGDGNGGWVVVSTSPFMTNIGVGTAGQAWAISNEVAKSYGSAGTDYDIYSWVNGSWVQQPGGAQKVSVAPGSSVPFVVNHAGTVYEGDCDASSCGAAGGFCFAHTCSSGCEYAPSNCTATVADPLNPQTGQHDPVNGVGFISVSCSAGPNGTGNGYYTVAFGGSSSGPWIGYSPYAMGTYQYPMNGQPLSFLMDEDDGYLPGPTCQYYNQCTIHATYVQVCAAPGAGELTEQSGVCSGGPCVAVPVTYK
ncbi:MAG TPA: tectonin domain-containing protein [Polyangiaceae bacterium]|jgi:hypothetical protein